MTICPIDGTHLPDGHSRCPTCDEDLSLLVYVEEIPRRLYNEGVWFAEANELVTAAGSLMASIRFASDFVESWIVLGKVYAQQGHYDEAIAAWQKVLVLDPTNQPASTGIQAVEALRCAAQIHARRSRALNQTLTVTGLALAMLVGGGLVQWWQRVTHQK